MGVGFDGLAGTNTWWWPNDPNAATGPSNVVAIINGIYRVYDKKGNILATTHIDSLFTGLNPSVSTLDPNITYDDIDGRWIIEANGSGSDITNAYLAVSDTSDPLQGFTEVHMVTFPGAWDGSKAGFNADVVVICATSGTAVIDKSTLLDKNNATFTITYRTASTFGRAARMHGSVPGGPMFWTAASGGQLKVTRMDNVLSNAPSLNSYLISGSSGASDPATPAWRNNSLVTANTGGAIWWQVNTAVTPPTLTQQGSIPAASGYVYGYCSANIAPNGDMGMTYMQYSSDTNARPVSMWVAWRAAGDPVNTMRTPVLAVSSAPLLQGNGRHGDFSSVVCDINTNGTTLNTFWACNGYVKPNGGGVTEASWHVNFGGAPQAPVIETQPANTNVVAGEPVTLSVLATNGEPFAYQWYKGGTGIAGGTNNPFSIPATSTNDAGNYTVVITNSEGSVTSVVAVLTVIPAYSGVWINPAGGSWTNPVNWRGEVVAGGIGQTADFSALNLTANTTVTLDAAQTIGSLLFADTVPDHNWALNPGAGGPLTMQVNSGVPTVSVSNQTATIGTAITGSQGLVKTGAGTLALSVQNTYTGGTTVNGGILDLTGGGGSSGVIRGSATINNGGTLRLSTGDAVGYGGGASALTTINLVGGTMNINTTANQTLGSATINLTGGSITGVSGGNLDFFGGGSALNSFASSVSSTISGVPLSPLRQGSATFYVEAGNTPGGIDLDISSVLRTSPSGDAANAVLIKTGPGVLRLSGANTYARPTAINAGTLKLGAGGSLASSTAITIAPGALFDVSTPGSFTLGSGKTLAAGRTLNASTDLNGALSSSGNINIAGTGVSGTFTINGNLILAGGALNYDLGPGASDLITLTGNSRTLSLSGTTTITPGNGYFPNGAYILINGYSNLIGSAANLAWGGTAGSNVRGVPAAAIAATSTNVSVAITGGTPANLSWQGNLSGAWDVNTTANWLNSVPLADTFFNLDTVSFADNPTTAAVTVTTNVYPAAVVFSNTTATAYTLNGVGSIAGSACVAKTSGNGTVYLNLTNTYSGGTTIGAGTISLGNNGNENTSGLGIGPVTINTGGKLMFAPGSTGNNFLLNNPVMLNGGIIWVEDGKQHLSNSVVEVAASGGTLNNKWGAKDLWIDSQLTGSGPLTLVHASGGDGGATGVHFSNPLNTYSGTITVSSTTTPAQVANSYALAKATVNLVANNGLVWDGVNSIVLGGLSGAGNLANGGNSLVVGNNNLNSAYSGILSGAGSLTKQGSGVFVMSGANTYTGATTVSAGTLQVDGSIGASLVTVGNTATLAGTGTIVGDTTVQGGGMLSPGDAGMGRFNFGGALTLNAGSTTVMELGKNGGVLTNDLVAVAGVLTMGGALTVTNIGANALAAGDSFNLFTAATCSGAFTTCNLPALAANLQWNTSQLSSSGTLSVIALAPPTISGAVAAGGGVQFSFSGNNGQTYRVLGCTNLLSPMASWMVLTNGAFGGGPVSFTDANTTNATYFYRVVSP